jgi:hypothetical protein
MTGIVVLDGLMAGICLKRSVGLGRYEKIKDVPYIAYWVSPCRGRRGRGLLPARILAGRDF